MNDCIGLANHEIKCIDDTVLVHNQDNNTVVQFNGVGGVMFMQLSHMLQKGNFSVSGLVRTIVDKYPEMRGNEEVVKEDFDNFLKELSKMGLVKFVAENSGED